MKNHQMCWMCIDSVLWCEQKYSHTVQVQPLLRLSSLWLHCSSWASVYPALFLTHTSPKEPSWKFLGVSVDWANSERQTLTAMRCVVLCRVANRKCRCAAGSRNSSSVVDASPPTVKCCSSVALIYCSGLFVVGGASSRPVMERQLLLRCSLHCVCMHCLYFPLQCF